jgi:hypothetical protein
MLVLRLSLLCLIATMSLPLLVQGQVQPQFVVMVRYARIDVPRSASDTCLVVFPDGRFHLEQDSEWPPPSKTQIFEDSLTKESLNSLTTLLVAEELKSLQTTNEEVKIEQGEMVSVFIPRGKAVQALAFAGFVGSATQPAKKLPAALEPLLNWFHTTVKGVKQQKLRALKGTKPTHCAF